MTELYMLLHVFGFRFGLLRWRCCSEVNWFIGRFTFRSWRQHVAACMFSLQHSTHGKSYSFDYSFPNVNFIKCSAQAAICCLHYSGIIPTEASRPTQYKCERHSSMLFSHVDAALACRAMRKSIARKTAWSKTMSRPIGAVVRNSASMHFCPLLNSFLCISESDKVYSIRNTRSSSH
jgi:hypothetical protein